MKVGMIIKNASGFVLSAASLIVAGVMVLSSCTNPADRYSELNDLSVANDKPSSSETIVEEQVSRKGVSITDFTASFSETKYAFDPKTGKYVRVNTPEMYVSQIPDHYEISGGSGSSGSSTTSQSAPSSDQPSSSPDSSQAQPAVPTTESTGSVASLSAAQQQKIAALIDSDMLDTVSFENSGLTDDYVISGGLLLGRDEIVSGFDTYIERDRLNSLCRDIFGIAPVPSGSKINSSYIQLKKDKCIIKKMPETDGCSKSITAVYDLGGDYYKVTASISAPGRSGTAIYIIKANSSVANGFVITAQKIN
ncbi:MAG: hypothetical protein IKS19_07405 [Clostridia bacterium]|nr:hypothetical protein [Clostridia bacterium]